jgi:chromosome segregation protein
MRIESIKLQGFKSFRKEAILNFPKNITAVVGPNGAGKSNIADGFRWVLGEQSLKTLRAKESIDVIFSGSEKQPKLSRALVMVKFGDCGKKNHDMVRLARLTGGQADQAIEPPSEIEITRKIYRSGESSYLLNKNEVRLLDIQLFLAQYNVGQKNYAVIGQGMIDAILKASPQDRLDFFYEATGVKKYQIKLHKARLKLKKSQERLNQTKTLIREISPHKKYLAAQAQKYLQRKAILDELSKKQTLYYKQAFTKIEEAYLNKKQDFQQIENQQKQIDRETKFLENQINQLKEKNGRQKHQELNNQLKKLEQEKRRQQDKLAFWEREKEHQLQEKGHVDLAYLYRRQGEVENLLNDLNSELSELAKLHHNLKQNYQTKQKELEETLQQIRNLQDEKKDMSPKRLVQSLRQLLELNKIEIIKNKIKSLILEVEATHQLNQKQELEQIAAEARTQVNELKVKIQVVQERQKMLQQNLGHWQSELADLRLKLNKQKNGVSKEWLKQWQSQKSKYQQDLQKTEESIDELLKKINRLEQEEENRQTKFFEWQKEYNHALNQQRHISQLWQAVKIEMARLEFKREQLKEEMSEHLLGSTIKTILGNKPTTLSDDIDLKSLKVEVKKLRQKATSLGEVEDGVLEEYKEIKQRFDFLTDQAQDLEAAIKSLDKISQRLQRRIKRQFREKFNKLNKQFQKYFKMLFNGGASAIKQIHLEDNNELGIEILAHPPGKKIKHIMALSGGEKSLVAVALICAIISSNPPPFVILDEIDAALDEANANLLSQILKTLSEHTQLIIITHNRSTMEIADVLYGVTMDKEGVSRLVGVTLEDYG